MSFLFTITASDGETRQASLEAGETLALAADERAELADTVRAEASVTLTEAGLVEIGLGGETVFLAGLAEHLENETGAGLVFADGGAIDSFGSLLEAAAASMADLVAEVAEPEIAGDVVYLYLGEASEAPASALVLAIGEVLDAGQQGSVLDGLGDGGGEIAVALVAGWADTEAVGLGGMAMVSGGDSEDDMLLGGLFGDSA